MGCMPIGFWSGGGFEKMLDAALLWAVLDIDGTGTNVLVADGGGVGCIRGGGCDENWLLCDGSSGVGSVRGGRTAMLLVVQFVDQR